MTVENGCGHKEKSYVIVPVPRDEEGAGGDSESCMIARRPGEVRQITGLPGSSRGNV